MKGLVSVRYFTSKDPLTLSVAHMYKVTTLESGIDVGQGITVGPGKFV